ncbi:MAG TPA: hypothetical protein IAB57_02050 [Candidatus Fimivivens faecavium]|nr:hypothetical protein [Candidatus Fimivivens faecavium]
MKPTFEKLPLRAFSPFFSLASAVREINGFDSGAKEHPAGNRVHVLLSWRPAPRSRRISFGRK